MIGLPGRALRVSADLRRSSGLVAAQGLRRPDAALADGLESARSRGRDASTRRSTSPRRCCARRIFWLMFVMMTMMSTTGLMVTSQMGAFTGDFGMASVLVWGLPLLPLALSLDRITNGPRARSSAGSPIDTAVRTRCSSRLRSRGRR